jgi:hypothetical protein
VIRANAVMPAGFRTSQLCDANYMYREPPLILERTIFLTMKFNRDYVVLALCFLFLASGLGLVVTVVALSPSLGVFNSTQVYVPEEIARGCVNCTIILISAGTTKGSSIPTFFILVWMVVVMTLANVV